MGWGDGREGEAILGLEGVETMWITRVKWVREPLRYVAEAQRMDTEEVWRIEFPVGDDKMRVSSFF